MRYTLRLEQFEGPLELLLKLIEDDKLDITTISLAKVTDEYLAYVNNEDQLPADEIADFLVVAAKLIYIKSKYLLPALVTEEDDGLDLEKQLKIYRAYYDASKAVSKLIAKHRFTYVRTVPLRLPREQKFSPPTNLLLPQMPAFFSSVLGKIQEILKLPRIVLASAMSIREKINALQAALNRGSFKFKEFHEANRLDIIVSFLALLELIKLREIVVDQTDPFSDITIMKYSSHE